MGHICTLNNTNSKIVSCFTLTPGSGNRPPQDRLTQNEGLRPKGGLIVHQGNCEQQCLAKKFSIAMWIIMETFKSCLPCACRSRGSSSERHVSFQPPSISGILVHGVCSKTLQHLHGLREGGRCPVTTFPVPKCLLCSSLQCE